jgi:hypothetical protein
MTISIRLRVLSNALDDELRDTGCGDTVTEGDFCSVCCEFLSDILIVQLACRGATDMDMFGALKGWRLLETI